MMGRYASLTAVLLLAAAPAPAWHAAPARAPHAMVVTEQHYATQVGVDVLRHGGNVVDAAVAVGYALAVVDPCCGNIGGGGFMIVRMHGGRERFIDFRERAPFRAIPKLYQDKNGNVIPGLSTKGYLAIGVPGTVMGLERARTEFGTRSRAALMAPAIALAKDGYVIGPGDARVYRSMPGDTVKTGDLRKQPDLANTLTMIARDGPNAFYRGPIAQAIVAASNAHRGILSMKDFASYYVNELKPVHCSYRGYDLISAPPPSSGGVTLCEILNVITPYNFARWGWNSLQSAHYAIEAERRAYADRNTYLGDPAFVKNPVSRLLNANYAAKLRASISSNRATPSSQVDPGLGAVAHENAQTTSFSIVDSAGNAVAVTYTINDAFGAGVIAGHTGFFLNDEMDDFTSKPGVPNMFGLVQGTRNDIRGGKRPLSSMTPTIVTHNGKLFMVTGSPGGGRIITIVLATLQNVIDYGMSVQDAVNAPRVHMQWLPDVVEYEPGAFSAQTMQQLQTMGYTLKEVPSWGSAQAIVIDQKTGVRFGGTDRRRPAGLAAGY
ncbi:MAG TPA: gamma-glutamyltransferase [Candidatus Rubrimentiphilum sp.]|nr:gamma-glutamyltransferase [Candidatus Rubrimentiphilum sp.]